jgi:hypothetical protein
VVAAVVSAVALACAPQPGAGNVAYVSAGALEVLDLGTCTTRTVVARGAAAPLAFSHDGRWIAFGNGKVVAAAGGKVLQPAGAVYRWTWSPTRDVLAGLTPAEALVEGGPSAAARVVAPAGWGANTFAWAPNGVDLAVGRGKFIGPASPKGIQQLVVFDAHGSQVVYRTPRGGIDPPDVSAWIGSRIYFQPDMQNSASIAADGLPLVALERRRARTVIAGMLPSLPLVACGSRTLIVAGGDRNTQTNKRIVAYDGARVRLLAGGPLVWNVPACRGDRIVAAAGPDRRDQSLIQPQRSIWLLAPSRRLTRSPNGWSDDMPTWTRDGNAIVFFRQRFGRGSLYVVRPSDRKLVGPLAAHVAGFAVSP